MLRIRSGYFGLCDILIEYGKRHILDSYIISAYSYKFKAFLDLKSLDSLTNEFENEIAHLNYLFNFNL